jgi:hypothetical protein
MNSFHLRSAGLALLVSVVCSGQPPKLAPDLQDVDPRSTVSVIVQFATPPERTQEFHRQIGTCTPGECRLHRTQIHEPRIPLASKSGECQESAYRVAPREVKDA